MDPSYKKNLELFKNSEFESIKGLFGINKMMIEGNSEINNVFYADVASSLWEKTLLLEEQAIKWMKARVYDHSDSVLCLGKQHGPEDAIERWTDQVSTLKMCHAFRELQGLDGEPIDFEWKIFLGPTALDILHETQADLVGKHVTPENFSDRIIFMSMFNNIMNIFVVSLQGRSKSTPQNSTKDTAHSWDPEKKASIKDMQPIMVANGIFVLHKWWKNREFRTSGVPGSKPAGPWNTQEEK